MGGLEGKAVCVTGASRGIGRAIALRLAREGASLLLAARNRPLLGLVAEEARALGGRPRAVVCDVRRPAQTRRLARAAEGLAGGLDALVNNAGAGSFAPLEELDEQGWEETLGTCLKGAYLCTRALLPLLERRGGHVINISSTAALVGFAGSAAYCAAKAGLEGFSRALAEELRPRGMRVSVVRPGPTRTDIWDAIPGEYDRSQMMEAEVVAESVAHILCQPPSAVVGDLTLLPASGRP
ncbi:MAG: SDR family oxidoreductase [Nitrospinota bacterium]